MSVCGGGERERWIDIVTVTHLFDLFFWFCVSLLIVKHSVIRKTIYALRYCRYEYELPSLSCRGDLRNPLQQRVKERRRRISGVYN